MRAFVVKFKNEGIELDLLLLGSGVARLGLLECLWAGCCPEGR
jgi:hypothetical protein